MITPSGVTVQEYSNAVLSDAMNHLRITYTDQNIVLDESDIQVDGIVINDILNGSVDLQFGSAVMKTVNANVFTSNKVANLAWDSEFKLEFGVEINGSTKWVTIGYFIGERPENYPVNGIVELNASDRMQRFDVLVSEFLSGIKYPITFGNLYHGLCDYIGIQYVAGDELPNIMSRVFTKSPFSTVDLTGRMVLSLLAEACGCYAKINPAGKVQMVWFHDNTSYAISEVMEFSQSAMNVSKGMTWAEFSQYTWGEAEQFTWGQVGGYKTLLAVDAINVKSTDNDIGIFYPSSYNGNVYYIIDNPFLYINDGDDISNYIVPIYERLRSFGGYLPMTIECLGNWLVESGDIITVAFNGENVKLPIFARTFRFNRFCTDYYEATGRIKRDKISSGHAEKISQLGKFHEIKSDIDGNYERIQDQFGNYYTKTETASKINQEIGDELGNYYTKSETASAISSAMGDALGNYYTKSETASVISSTMGDALGNYYTKSETASVVSSAMEDALGNYYTKSETASVISSAMGDALGNYYTKTETASQISHAISDNNNNYYTKSETASQISTSISDNNQNYYTKTETASEISVYVGNHAYEKVNGIAIDQAGVEVTGQKYVKIMSGGVFLVDSTNFKIDSEHQYFKVGNWAFSYNGLYYKQYLSESLNHFSLFGDSSYEVQQYDPYELIQTKFNNSTKRNYINFELCSGKYSGMGYNERLIARVILEKLFVDDPSVPDKIVFRPDFVAYGKGLVSRLGNPAAGERWDEGYIKELHVTYTANNSSREVKHDIKKLPECGETIDKLEPVSFVYNDDTKDRKRYGLIYEDAVEVMPDICLGDPNGEAEQKTINYTDLIPVLLKEIQSLRKRVAELEQKCNCN